MEGVGQLGGVDGKLPWGKCRLQGMAGATQRSWNFKLRSLGRENLRIRRHEKVSGIETQFGDMAATEQPEASGSIIDPIRDFASSSNANPKQTAALWRTTNTRPRGDLTQADLDLVTLTVSRGCFIRVLHPFHHRHDTTKTAIAHVMGCSGRYLTDISPPMISALTS